MKNKYYVHTATGMMENRKCLGTISVDDETAMDSGKLMRAARKKFRRKDLMVDLTRLRAPAVEKTPPILGKKKHGYWQ